MPDSTTTAEQIGKSEAVRALFPEGAEEAMQAMLAGVAIPAPQDLPTQPEVVEKAKKNFVFRFVYFLGRQYRRALEFSKRHWRDLAQLVFAASVGFGVGLVLRLLTLYLFSVNPLLGWAFVSAIVAQAAVTFIAFVAKTTVDRRRYRAAHAITAV